MKVAGHTPEPQAPLSLVLPHEAALPPPPPDQIGVVPWDPPEPPAPVTPLEPVTVQSRLPVTRSVTLGGVRLSGRAAGFVDAGYQLVRTVRDNPGTSAAVIGAGLALGVVAPSVMLALTIGVAAYGAGSIAYHELRAAGADKAADREKQRFASGEAMFLTLTSLPFRGLRGIRAAR